MNMKCLIGSVITAVLLVGGFFWALFVNPDIIGFVVMGIFILALIGVLSNEIYKACQQYSPKDILARFNRRTRKIQ